MSGRFNSWDLVHPHRLADLLATAAAALQRPALLGLILAFGAILWLCYAAFDIWMDGLAWRLAHRHARRHPSEHQHSEDASEKDPTHAPA
jgi:hypothetical protein